MRVGFYTCPECGGKMIKIEGCGWSCSFCGHQILLEEEK